LFDEPCGGGGAWPLNKHAAWYEQIPAFTDSPSSFQTSFPGSFRKQKGSRSGICNTNAITSKVSVDSGRQKAAVIVAP